MRKPCARKNRKLLSTNQRVQSVNCRNACLNEFSRIVTGCRVHRKAVDVEHFFRNNVRTAALRSAHTVEYTTEHIRRYRKLRTVSEEAHRALLQVDALRRLEKLNQRVMSVDFEDFAKSFFPARKQDFAKFIVGNIINILDQHQRSYNFTDCLIFSNHPLQPPLLQAH